MLDAVIAQNESAVAQHVAHPRRRRRGLARRGAGPQLRHLGRRSPRSPSSSTRASRPRSTSCPSIRPYPLGHIGDGNVHFSLHGRRRAWTGQTLQQYAPAITRAVNDLITSMAGSISAEHGIGIDKLDELAHYRSQDRARHHAHHQARARSEEHHEPGQGAEAVVTLPSPRAKPRGLFSCSARKRSLHSASLRSGRRRWHVSDFVDKLRTIVGDKGLITDDAGQASLPHRLARELSRQGAGRSCGRRRPRKWRRS